MEKNDIRSTKRAQKTVTPPAAPARRKQAVIFDAGDHAWLETVEPGMTIGSSFHRRGMLWEITGFRKHVHAYVARPVLQ